MLSGSVGTANLVQVLNSDMKSKQWFVSYWPRWFGVAGIIDRQFLNSWQCKNGPILLTVLYRLLLTNSWRTLTIKLKMFLMSILTVPSWNCTVVLYLVLLRRNSYTAIKSSCCSLLAACIRLLATVCHKQFLNNGISQELKIQMALQVKSGIFPVQWQCRFKTLVSTVSFC